MHFRHLFLFVSPAMFIIAHDRSFPKTAKQSRRLLQSSIALPGQFRQDQYSLTLVIHHSRGQSLKINLLKRDMGNIPLLFICLFPTFFPFFLDFLCSTAPDYVKIKYVKGSFKICENVSVTGFLYTVMCTSVKHFFLTVFFL